MKLYLESTLSNHRHGRFFISQLEAETADDFCEDWPDEGLILMHGKKFQGFESQQQNEWWSWSTRPGCTLLLIPPFNTGNIFEKLDWNIVLTDEVSLSDDAVFTTSFTKNIINSVADEVSQSIDGADGEFDRSLGYQWSDYSVNTRYYKQHSGSGVFAVTCLPLWSISLLEFTSDTIEWLEALLTFSGSSSDVDLAMVSDSEVVLEPVDYTIMVCLEALGLKSMDEIKTTLDTSKTKVISLTEQEIIDGFERLKLSGFLDEHGLTTTGSDALANSVYWAYSERLKESSTNKKEYQ